MERSFKQFPMPPSNEDLDDPRSPQESELGLRPTNSPKHQKQKPKRYLSKYWLIVGIFIILIILSGVFWLSKHHHLTPKTNRTTSKSTIQPVPTTTSSNTAGQYISNGQDLNLSFSYPSNWVVAPPSNDNASDQTITVTSPLMSIINSAGATVTGQVVISIQPGNTQMSGLASGNATAAQNSVQIGYSKPVASQQQYPYLTFINQAGGKDPTSVFSEVMITGLAQFNQGQPVNGGALAGTLDPIISASFYNCATQACSGSSQTPLYITNSTWLNTDPFLQVLSLFESLQLN